MNISIPHSWLKEFLTTNATPEKIAECLSLCGPSVENLTKSGGDWIYEIEVTTNRVDCLSVMGIAREAAAILPQFGFKAKLVTSGTLPEVNQTRSFPLQVKVDHDLCPRFAAVAIKNVTIKPSPEKIQAYLEKSGIRAINNIVDISNYLMRAYGQPVHTFDLDKIKEKMILRLSQKGESLTTLDGKTFILPGGDIVIEDGGRRLIDLCGIMGGENSAIDAHSRNVLLFVQTYSAKRIRETSMRLGQRSEAAQIFEKQPDPEAVMPVIIKGIKLFKDWGGGQQDSKIIDLYPQPYKPKMFAVPIQLINDRLGVDISKRTIINILESLKIDCKLKIENSTISVKVPSWRAKDINIPEDIVEEVARIYGYHKLPSFIMASPISTNYPGTNFNLEFKIKSWLSGWGLNEIYTNSMVSAELARKSGYRLEEHLKIKNALSEDWQYLRRSLLPQHQQNFPAFEMAHTYHPGTGKLPEEKLELIISGFTDWLKLKGIVDALAAKLHTPVDADYKPGAAVIDLSSLLPRAKLYPHYRPLSSFAPVIEDLTFTLPEKTYIGPVIDTIKNTDKLIAAVELTETYQQNHTFKITYQSHTKALSSESITPLRKKIVDLLKTKFKTRLVGQLN